MKKNVIHFLNHITDFSYIFHALGLLALGNKYVSVCFVQVWYKKATKRDSYSVSYPPDLLLRMISSKIYAKQAKTLVDKRRI